MNVRGKLAYPKVEGKFDSTSVIVDDDAGSIFSKHKT